MSYIYAFQRLEVYQVSKELVKDIYILIGSFPTTERYGLCDQIRRAAVSIPSNIAEGVSRMSDKEKSHFLEISYGSLMEVLCQLEISKDLGYINELQFDEFQLKVERVSKLITALRRNYLSRT